MVGDFNRKAALLALSMLAALILLQAGPLSAQTVEIQAQVQAPPVPAPPVPVPFDKGPVIDPKTPLEKLLPTRPDVREALAPWLVKDLTQVPEILFHKPVFGQQNIIQEMAQINHVNKKGTDEFLKLLLKNRPDLAGLPFMMGEACRLDKEKSRRFKDAVEQIHDSMAGGLSAIGPLAGFVQGLASQKREVHVALDAALMQILAPQPVQKRQGLIKFLSLMKTPEATRSLARLAVFSVEKEIRTQAVNALKDRPAKEASAVLLNGLRYPWPAVSAQAADAMVQLERKDLLPQLVAFLDQPDPRAPVLKETNGRKTTTVREVVRINHHHNCMLCHAPANTSDVVFERFGKAKEVPTGAVPIPGQELPSPSEGYGFSSPDMLVRVDVTYLRQDFSLMQPVKNARPWPEMQRFDFIVRTRELSDKDVAAYRTWREQQGAGYLSPNHRAALGALRALTGRDAAPNAQAWRKVLDL
jgi:hypothetical protein